MEQQETSLNEIQPDTTVEILFYMDLRSNSLQLIRDYCMFEQGRHPCLGDLRKPCYQRFMSCNYRKICADEIGRLQERFGDLPDWVQPFSTKWTPETFELKCQINNGATRTNIATGEKDMDMGRRTLLTIQYLLKDWDLDLPLEFEPIPNMSQWKKLNQNTMQRISHLPPDFVELLAEGATINNRKFGDISKEARLYFRGGAQGGTAEKLYVFKTLWKEFGMPYYIVKNLSSNAIEALLTVVGAEAQAKQEAIEKARR